ncbi:MAG: glucosaminidase domain-containing protein [Eubacterium sp.]|nr:glucosaminidase domain-containing protein [Eubacterium sp.]
MGRIRSMKKLSIMLVLALVISGVFGDGTSVLADTESRLEDYVGADTLVKDHVISGRVLGADLRPAVGITVRIEKQILYHADFDETRTAWVTYDTAVTDERGEYSIPVASYRIYRLAAGGDLSVHSKSVWLNDTDATLDLSVAFHTLQGLIKREDGTSVSDMPVTVKRIGDTGEESVPGMADTLLTYADTLAASGSAVSGSAAVPVKADPVVESAYSDDMDTVTTNSEGIFTYGELPPGYYQLMIGHVGQIVRYVQLDSDDFVLLSLSEDQLVMEEYRDGVLESVEDAWDYGAELDLPGSLLPTPTPTSDPMAVPNMSGSRLFPGDTVYTDYAYTLEDYARIQYNNVPRVSYDKYLSLIDPSKDTTKNMKFLRVDTYRPVNEEAFTKLYQSMIESYCRATHRDPSESVLYGKAKVILKAAKKYKIDPVFLTTQTFHESAYGTSRLASGITISQVAFPGYPRDKYGKFITKSIDNPVTVYNLYGIKAYDADPVTGGTSYAYYNGWTSPTKAIEGAAAYLADNYIHGTNIQNTPFKIRFSFRERIWHQYATGPTYAEDLARYMITMSGVYSVKAKFTYDLPRYKKS